MLAITSLFMVEHSQRGSSATRITPDPACSA
jgi:hypothetical protein